MKKLLCAVSAVALTAVLAACGQDGAAPSGSSQPSAGATEKTVLKVMHARPDPTDPLYIYYEDVKARFEAAHPEYRVEYEIYDGETYKKKLQIYGTSNTMPDVFYVWSNPSEFDPYVNAGLAAELNPADFASYDFLPGALENATVDGKLVGLPMSIDYWYLYVNQKLFDDNGIKVPTTLSEMKEAVKAFNALDIAPVVMNGKELWNQSVLLDDFLFRFSGGDPEPRFNAVRQQSTFASNPAFTEAANAMKELIDLGMFQSSWESDDDATAKNLFLQGKAAMRWTGTWENGMVSDAGALPEVRDNLTIIPFPSPDGTDLRTSLEGREGTSMMVSAASPNKEAGIEFLKTFFDPAVYPKACIEQNITIPMQTFESYVPQDAPPLIKTVASSIASAKSVSSHPFSFALTPAFEQASKDLNMAFFLGQIDAAELWKQTDEAAAANQVQ
ncbi:MAG: extracellular solute-binding protein [Propionicimonas sp.]